MARRNAKSVLAAMLLIACACASPGAPPPPDNQDDGGNITGQDSGPADSGSADSGSADSGNADAGDVDAGQGDAGDIDSGTPDSGTPDSGTDADAGQTDAGDPGDGGADAGTIDPGSGADAGPGDAGVDGGVACNPPTEDWLVYRHDLAGSGRSNDPLPKSAAAALTQTWIFDDSGHGGYNYSNPIVDGDTVYLSSGIGYLFALDAATGRPRWHAAAYAPHYVRCDGSDGGIKGPIGAPAVVGDRVFMPSGSGSIDTYDKATGQLLWSTKIADPMLNEFIFSSAFPAVGRLYIGIASIFDCQQVVAGRVVALDQLTGAITGTWYGDENRGPGATVWSSPSYDAATNRVFLTTGTLANGKTKAEQPLAQAFVAFDPDTMATLDYFSPVNTTFAADLEFGASPLLFDAGGRHLIGAATKGGVFYVLDRNHLSDGIVWQRTISGYGFNPDQGDGSIVSATVSGDGATVFVGGGITLDGYKGGIYAFDAATGAPRWTTHTAGFILGALSAAGEVVFGTATDETTFKGTLYALDAATGAVVFSLGGFKPLFGEVTYARGKLFLPEIGTVVSGGGRLLAYTPGPVCP